MYVCMCAYTHVHHTTVTSLQRWTITEKQNKLPFPSVAFCWDILQHGQEGIPAELSPGPERAFPMHSGPALSPPSFAAGCNYSNCLHRSSLPRECDMSPWGTGF